MAENAFLDRLCAITGARHVITDAHEMAPYLVERRELFRGRARAIVCPGTATEVSSILAFCHDTATPVVPQGGNTGLVGGQTPDNSGRAIVLSLRRLTKLRELDLDSGTMIVEAGMTLAAVQAAAERVDRLFPLSLASEGSCTIGGNLATNAGGTAVIAYGNARDLVLGLEVVLADGRIVSTLNKLKKDNTGYDLKHLFIGSEGTLGVITAAVLKLFPRPRAVETAFIGLTDPRKALELWGLVQEAAGYATRSFEIVPRIGIDFVLRHAPGCRDPLQQPHAWYVLLELTSQTEHGLAAVMTRLLESALERGLIEDAVLAVSVEQARAFWRLREALSEVQRCEGASIKHDVSVPVAAVPAFLNEASQAVQTAVPASRVVAFGHLGDGNIHFNLSQPAGGDRAAFLARWHEINDIVHRIVTLYGGSISAEHGIGQLKRDLLTKVKDPVALDAMRAIKRVLDPNGILNPGKVL